MERIDCMDRERALQSLRGANLQCSEFFRRFGGAPVAGSEDEVNALRGLEQSLQAVAVWLDRGVQSSGDSELRDELMSYRGNLVRLRRELGRMQESATACRARIFARQQHLDAAQAWCTASRDTC